MPLENSDYTVGWISPLYHERASAEGLLDEEHEGLPSQPGDDNAYTLGKMGQHNIVIAGLPTGTHGTISTSIVAANLLRSFPNVRFGLLVGIGGGVPSNDLRLGDIVVSTPEGTNGGVIQYDSGKAVQGSKFIRKGSLNKPPPVLANAVGKLRARAERKGYSFQQHFDEMLERYPKMKSKFTRPSTDNLYASDYIHEGTQPDCAGCSSEKLIPRPERSDSGPSVFYGTIGSAPVVLRDAQARDEWHAQMGIICFEMEAAGLMDNFPCVVIRGICDYADTHKNDEWQPHAGAMAAAFAKELLLSIAPTSVTQTPQANHILHAVTKLSKQQDQQMVDLHNIESKIDLATLPYAKGAAYDSISDIDELDSRCLENTRVKLLQDIRQWATSSTSRCIFWLNGMAGTGKSTIARTVAKAFADDKQLGASFFFKNGEGDRDKAGCLFTTIAAQLINFIPEMRSQVRKALEDDPNIADKALKPQFEQLLLNPLREVKNPVRSTMIIVIDALDECENEVHIKTIVKLLPQLQLVKSMSVRTVVTSRPELPLRLGFETISKDAYQDLILHEIEHCVVRNDISLFLEYKFDQIRRESGLPTDWPGKKAVDTLTAMATPLFIFAATVCRFVGHTSWNPKERLKHVLDYQSVTDLDQMDKTYRPILDRILDAKHETNQLQREKLIENFRKVVGPIVILADHLSVNSLSNLLQLGTWDIYRQLNNLHSVLSVTADPNCPVRPLHLSFPNYLLDQKRRDRNQFWINETDMHKSLAYRCIQLLRNSKALKQDICDLQRPGVPRHEIEQSTISRCIPPELRYACCYWIHHLENSHCRLSDQDDSYLFLKERFLYWLEAMSLLGQSSSTIKMITTLQTLFDENGSLAVKDFLNDARRFVLANHMIADVAPLQLYCSSLTFAPQQSVIRNSYRSPKWLIRAPLPDERWGSTLQTLEGHSKTVTSVSFSHDGKQLASASYDGKVRIWETASGALSQELDGDPNGATSVAFSSDGKLASGLACRKIMIWDSSTGFLQHILEGHSAAVNSVVFSPDGKQLASASSDGTIRLWDAASGALQQILDQAPGRIYSITFSPDGKHLASGSGDGAIKIWSATGSLRQTLRVRSHYVASVAFSPDGKHLACALYNGEVEIWNTIAGSVEGRFRAHPAAVKSVMFSPDGKQLASGGTDGTIKLWAAGARSLQQTLQGHSHTILSVAFSPDGKKLATASQDKTIRIWELDNRPLDQRPQGNANRDPFVISSSDGKQLISCTDDESIEIWDVATGSLKQRILGHLPCTSSIVFSPDGKQLASGFYEEPIKIWDAATGSLKCAFQQENVRYVDSVVAFSPDGKQLASGSDKIITLWDTATESLRRTVDGHQDDIRTLAFSLDGRWLASASDDLTIKVWDASTGSLQRTLQGLESASISLAFSPSGERLASGTCQKSIGIWDVATGSLQQTIKVENSVSRISFHPTLPILNTSAGQVELERRNDGKGSGSIGEARDLYVVGDWILRGNEKILWLPPEYRSSARTAFAGTGQTLAFHSASDCMMFFEFAFEEFCGPGTLA